jgi:uncharacterized protein with von Willebrand factor type A (vWA) domain
VAEKRADIERAAVKSGMTDAAATKLADRLAAITVTFERAEAEALLAPSYKATYEAYLAYDSAKQKLRAALHEGGESLGG